mgnify:FL=1
MPNNSRQTTDRASQRLRLRALDSQFRSLCVQANADAAASYLCSGELPDDWLSQWRLMAMRLKDLHQDPAYLRWSLRAIIWRETGEMIGHIGFHTPPDPDYLATLGTDGIEIGYEIYPNWRRQGLGREALQRLLQFAQEQGVQRFILSIAPDNQPSLALARSLGFVELGQQVDGEEGLELLYRLESNKSGSADPDSPKRQ